MQHYPEEQMIDMESCVFRPAWTNMQVAGLVPLFLISGDDTPAKDQLEAGYGFPYPNQDGFTLRVQRKPSGAAVFTLSYPDDPDLEEVSRCGLDVTGEIVVMFEYAYVAVITYDKESDTFSLKHVGRMD